MLRATFAGAATTVAAAITLAVATPATAAPTPTAFLVLTVSHSEEIDAPARTEHGYLTCAPAGGRHHDPATACAELAAARGDLDATDNEAADVMCTKHYAPVTVRAVGWYDGAPVDHTKTYGNSCVFAATAGPLWQL